MINSLKKNMITRALAGTALLSSFTALAATESVTLSFVTVADLVITQTQAIAFGSSIIGAAGSTCVMSASVLAANTGNTGTIVDADIEAGLTGDGCLNVTAAASTGLAGVYSVAGIDNQVVELTLQSGTGTGFTFTPLGFAVEDDSTTDFSSPTTLFATVATNHTLGDAGANIVVGGTLDIDAGAALDSGKPYSLTYDIVASY